MSFLIWNAKNKIRTLKAFDKNDQSYQETLRLLEKDEFFDKTFLDEIPSAELNIKKQLKILSLPDYQRYDKEYERIKKADKRNPNWYSLFNGPKSIQQLALKVNIPFLYEILYRKWSENVHGTDIISGRIVKRENPNLEAGKVNADIVQINIPKDAQEITSYTLLLILMTIIKLRDKKLKKREQEIKEWYISVRPEYHQIFSKTRLINVIL